MHLAILREPYLSLILNGKKTIESRFSKDHRPPYESITPGDIIILKSAAGPISGVAVAKRTLFFTRFETWDDIRKKYAKPMCAHTDEFWSQRAEARFATLVELQSVIAISNVGCEKKDRRGWVVLSDSNR